LVGTGDAGVNRSLVANRKERQPYGDHRIGLGSARDPGHKEVGYRRANKFSSLAPLNALDVVHDLAKPSREE